jgi:glycyl-tRNA synthetase beta chain
MSESRGATFLLEVGTEEIPDRMLEAGAEAFRRRMEDALAPLGILEPDADWCVWSTPRRLVLMVGPIRPRQEDREEEVTGPPVRAAFDAEGKPTKALEGFARTHGVTVEDISRVRTPKGEYVGFRRTVNGRPSEELLAEAVPPVLQGLHFPKMMCWGEVGFRFVRPIRWIVALLGGDIVAFEVAGVSSGRCSRGHRTLSAGEVTVAAPESYLDELRGAGVLVDPDERRAAIQAGLARAAAEVGGDLIPDEALLESLVSMTEQPAVIAGSFPSEYLEIPREVLVTAMRHHQHYFSVARPGTAVGAPELLPAFLAVINQAADASGNIRRGNEWVLRARLADSRFFWEEDRKRSLESRLPDLDRVIFQERLGSYRRKAERVSRLVEVLGRSLGLGEELARRASRAALLSKCDLTTEMVGEFPELQGVVGGLYAAADGEAPEVGRAVYDHYRPAGAGDGLPRDGEGLLLALADRLDTLAGYFLIGAEPTGTRDPFALRRAGSAVVRILMEAAWLLSLEEALAMALEGYEGLQAEGDPAARLGEFFRERTRQVAQGAGHRYDSVNAVLAVQADDPRDAALRLEALSKLRADPELEAAFLSLSVAHKRIRNLVGEGVSRGVSTEHLVEAPEVELHRRLEEVDAQVQDHLQARDYLGALSAIASLRSPVDGFLGSSREEGVLVMSPDARLRDNRLGLLAGAGDLFSRIADFSEIVVEGEK